MEQLLQLIGKKFCYQLSYVYECFVPNKVNWLNEIINSIIIKRTKHFIETHTSHKHLLMIKSLELSLQKNLKKKRYYFSMTLYIQNGTRGKRKDFLTFCWRQNNFNFFSSSLFCSGQLFYYKRYWNIFLRNWPLKRIALNDPLHKNSKKFTQYLPFVQKCLLSLLLWNHKW